jgi:CRP/FNR family cyclic AMP-dependent transcriptional regulator
MSYQLAVDPSTTRPTALGGPVQQVAVASGSGPAGADGASTIRSGGAPMVRAPAGPVVVSGGVPRVDKCIHDRTTPLDSGPHRGHRGRAVMQDSDAAPDEFMAQLDPADRDALTQRARTRRWPSGASLFLEGELSSTVVVVVSGRVKVFSLTDQGEEVVLAVRGAGALLGELSAVDGAPRSASVAALEPVIALVLPTTAFTDYLSAHGRAAMVLLRLIAGRQRDADRKRVEFAAYDTAARVARRLVELADRFGEPDGTGVRITVALSQDELAGWVGASREAVAKALRTLRERGFLTTGRRAMTVLDLDGLRKRGGGL